MTQSSESQTSDAEVERLRSQLSAYMERMGFRSTTQRRLVSEVFFNAPGHLSLDDILARVKDQDSKVGYATVYRTMKLLVECGLASARQFGDAVTRYEVAHDEHHDHLICLECQKIIEFESDEIERLQDQVAKDEGFKLVNHKHELYGLCADCQKA